MKLIAYIILAVALSAGALSAVSAYRPQLSLPDDQLIGLTINGSQGTTLTDDITFFLDETTDQTQLLQSLLAQPNDDARRAILASAAPNHPLIEFNDPTNFFQPVAVYSSAAGANNTVTQELLDKLRAAGVERITVKEFSISRWQHSWLMLLSVAGLTLAALMLRAARPKPSDANTHQDTESSPSVAIQTIDKSLSAVRAAVHSSRDEREALARIVKDLGELQLGPVDSIVNAREQFVAKHGLSAYAAFMDQFAALERKINRAWSTAADNHLPESTKALDDALALIEQVKANIPA